MLGATVVLAVRAYTSVTDAFALRVTATGQERRALAAMRSAVPNPSVKRR
jgi:hypothetical protein